MKRGKFHYQLFIKSQLLNEKTLSNDLKYYLYQMRNYILTVSDYFYYIKIFKSSGTSKWVAQHKPNYQRNPIEDILPYQLFCKPIIEGNQLIKEHIPVEIFQQLNERLIYSAYGYTEFENVSFRVKRLIGNWKSIKVTEIMKYKFEESIKQQQQLIEVTDLTKNFQRKIAPWSISELVTDLNPRSQLQDRERQPIIVLASLIDRVPNLAGLSRTCEIFLAEKLVIENKAVIKKDEFKSISVTSEFWLPIEECKIPDIAQYIDQKKNEGYVIVGAEQTQSSISIEKFKFPKKCLLVLGREKEGIPVELIQKIDYCVEIPQLGVIRYCFIQRFN